MTASTNDLPTAGLIRRLMAMVYDGLLLLGVAFAYGVVIWGLRKLAGDDTMEPLHGLAATLELAGLWLVLSGYYVLCWLKRGQTLGMKSWRLCLQSTEGGAIRPATAWLRTLLAVVSALPAALGYLWVLLDRRGGCWHDRWSRTRVVVLPKQKPRAARRDPEPPPAAR